MKVTKIIGLSILPLFLMAQSCYESSVVTPSPFMGNNGEIFKLNDGTIGEIKYEYEYMYEYNPNVIICPDKAKMIVKGKSLSIEIHSKRNNNSSKNTESYESQVDGDFNGFEGETIIKLFNGQIWQQSDYYYHYHYSFMPKVIIYKTNNIYKMQVEGVDKSISVIRLK